jgi:hypothetical protein
VGIETEFERMGSFVRDFVRLENLEGIKSEVKIELSGRPQVGDGPCVLRHLNDRFGIFHSVMMHTYYLELKEEHGS